MVGQLHSFYFVNDDVVFFVPCIHMTQESRFPVDRSMTVCVVLHDILSNHGNRVIEMIANGGRFKRGTLFLILELICRMLILEM